MNIVAYIISAVAIAITSVLLIYTIVPLFNKTIKLDNKKTIIWFIVIIAIIILELFSISVSLFGETHEYAIPAPSSIWLIFKVFSLVFLWAWSFFYFFIWTKFQQNKK